tara:strand:- start:1194 stop:3017 length:1824 start_codon:yes stop_codon:yes gene_type:complete
MRLLFYLFIFSQFVNVIGIFAEKVKNESTGSDSIKWEKINEKKSNNLKKILWKSYDHSNEDIENKISEKDIKKNSSNIKKKKTYFINGQKPNQEFIQVQPHLPLNNFLSDGEYSLSTYWISAFDGGAAGGTGHQNYAFKFDYGLSDYSLFSIYLSETDDPLYKPIDGEIIPNNWASIALGYKKKLFESENSKNALSFATSLEYWVVSSASFHYKSIYNEIDNSTGLDRHELLIYSFSFPFTRDLNSKTSFSFIPGVSLIPDKIGDKYIGKNFYGNNYFLASSLIFDVINNVQFIGSYTYLFGPGHNSFNESITYKRVPIYSYGLNWNVNPIIAIQGKITNGYGVTPSTSLLTIPSDNKPLYYLGGSYKPFRDDTKFISLNKNDNLLLFGGLTVDNALLPPRGVSQLSFNYDNKGNLFTMYGYSLSNIFQLEIDTGSFNNVNLVGNKHPILEKTYLRKNNFNYRFGGKLLLLSPQKNDSFWSSLKTTVGRNNDNSQGYLFSEFINTFRVNDWIVFNLSPKYLFSGVKSIGALGVSSYISLFDNVMLIPEINTSIKNDSDFNSSLALRYSFQKGKSIDLYYSNAAGIQDIGQLFEDRNNRFGLKLNLLY